MNKADTRPSITPRFSLLHLLTLTALIAIGTAAGLAYQKNRNLIQQRDGMLSLSSRLQVDDDDVLAMSELPKVAGDFQSWNVHIPAGDDYALRLGIGEFSRDGIPLVVSEISVAAGRHRVTIHAGDSPHEAFRYVVYVDGKQLMEKTMGSDWIPDGWSSSRGLSWPHEPERSPAPLQLVARSYAPKLDFGKGSGHFFHGQNDSSVTRKGYRLWIDLADRRYPPASPFMSIGSDPNYPGPRHEGIGLRDGLRYEPSGRLPYEWTFTRPQLWTNEPLLRVSAEFFASDGKVLSSQTPSFQSWQLRNDRPEENGPNRQPDPPQSTYSAFLQARLKSSDASQPVIEMKWDRARPDEVGLRLADTRANEQISRWRLRILGGIRHLWRELQLGDQTIDAADAIKQLADKPSNTTITLDLGENARDSRLRWQTDETLPLQIIERKQSRYAGLGLYRGLPVSFGIEVPTTLEAAVEVKVLEESPGTAGKTFPGGNVFDEIQVEFEAANDDWIWLEAKRKE